jgi:PAS domain S-box-containing protein
MASNGAERHVEFGLVRQVDRVKLALVLLSAVVVLGGGDSIVIYRPLAGFVLTMSALLTLWSYFVLRWEEIAADGKLPIFVTAFVIVDLGLAACFVEATGGFRSPFWPILLIPVIFAAIFFSGARLALPLTAAMVAIVISVQAEPERVWDASKIWELLSRLGIIAIVAWIAWALSAVLERERRANQTIVRHLMEGALLVGPDNSVLLANPALARMCGIPVHDMIGRRLPALIDADSDLLAQIVQDADERPASTMTRDLALQAGRSQTDLRCITVPCADEDGQPLAWLVVVQDLTEIRALTRMKERSIGMLSHELRSPLTSMRGLARVLTGVTGALSTAEQRQALAFLEKESDRLSRLVTDMLDVACLEQGQAQLETRQIRIEQNLERVVSMFEAQAESKQISLRWHVTGHLPPVLADPDRVSQILVALVDNALKHTPSGGKITVRAATRGGRAEVRVKDTGCGIPPEALSLIFEKFGQAVPEGDYVLEERGLGLGLYLAQLLARKLGGELTVRSTMGEGSTFTLSLPLAHPEPEPAAFPALLPAASAG